MSADSDVLSSIAPARSRSGGPAFATLAIGTAAVLIAGTGTVYAVGSAIGGGQQPEEVLPASAVAMMKIDLDPGLGQQKAVYDLSKKFKGVKARGAKSVKDDLLSSAFQSDGPDLNYARDVKPWLGDRVAIAAVPDGSSDGFAPVAAVQYKDKAKAEKTLKAHKDNSFAYAFRGDYVVIANTQAEADRYAGSDKHLSDKGTYKAAIDALDGDQLVLGWADLKGLYNAVPKADLKSSPFADMSAEPSGSLVVGAHADSHFLEIRGKSVDVGDSLKQYGGTTLGTGKGHNLLATFPADTAAAFEATGLGESLTKAYNAINKDDTLFGDVEKSAKQMGFNLPGDLPAVFGEDFALGAFGNLQDSPSLVAHVRTTEGDRAVSVLNGLQPTEDGPPLAVQRDADGYYIGTDQAAVTAATNGTLGQTDAFQRALPDAKTAGFALFVDIAKASSFGGASVPADAKNLEAFGLTADAARGEFRIRLTVR